MLPKILTVDFNADHWTIQLQRADGRRCQANFTPDAFRHVRQCSMGQFLLHAWLARADVVPEDQPRP